MDRRTLRFGEPVLEARYTAETTPVDQAQLQLACLMNAPLWLVGGIIAPPIIGVPAGPIWAACAFMIVVLLSTAWFAGRPRTRRELAFSGLLVNVASAVVIVSLGVVTGLFDRFAGMLIILSGIVAMTIQRLPLPLAVTCAIFQVVVFSVVAVLFGSAAGFQIFVVGSTLAITMVGVYLLESKERRDFAQSLLIADLYRRVDRLFHRYLSPDVAALLLDSPDRAGFGGEVVDVTVLFADLTGFTPYSERTDPEEVVAMLNSAYGAAVPAIFAEGGTIIQFMGDALMAIFNAPVRQPDHALRAARAALALQQATAHLEVDPESPRFRVGLSSGPVLVGDVGSDDMRNFLAIGDTTNLASRIQTFAPPGRVVIGQETYALIEGWVEVKPLGTPELKGKSAPVALFELLAVRESMQAIAP